jgi:hypothetical protein
VDGKIPLIINFLANATRAFFLAILNRDRCSSVLLTCGNSSDGTSFPKNEHSGSHLQTEGQKVSEFVNRKTTWAEMGT